MKTAINSVDTDSFGKLVLKSSKPVVVDFWAEWCGPCRMLEPVLEQLKREYENRIEIYKLNVDLNQELAMQYSVMSLPTVCLFKDGQVVDRMTGYVPKSRLVQMIEKVL